MASELYSVEITEVVKKTVCVEADTPEKAEEIAKSGYENGKYLMDKDISFETSFKCKEA